MLKIIRKVKNFAAFLPLFSASAVLAQIRGGTPPPPAGAIRDLEDVLEKIIQPLVNWVFGLALALALIYLILGGVNYLRAGGGDPKVADAAKAQIKNGFIGVLIIVGVWVLISIAAGIVGVRAPR